MLRVYALHSADFPSKRNRRLRANARHGNRSGLLPEVNGIFYRPTLGKCDGECTDERIAGSNAVYGLYGAARIELPRVSAIAAL